MNKLEKISETILGFFAGTSIGAGVIIFTNMFLKRGNCMGEDLVWKFANRLILNDDVPKEMKDLIEKEKLKFDINT